MNLPICIFSHINFDIIVIDNGRPNLLSMVLTKYNDDKWVPTLFKTIDGDSHYEYLTKIKHTKFISSKEIQEVLENYEQLTGENGFVLCVRGSIKE